MRFFASNQVAVKTRRVTVTDTLPLKREQATGNRQQATDCFRWGFQPHLKRTTYRSRGLWLKRGNRELSKLLSALEFPIHEFDEFLLVN